MKWLAVVVVVLGASACQCGPSVTSQPCACAQPGHGFERCVDGVCAGCQCLTKAPALADDAQAKTFFVDPDVLVKDGDGSAARPWVSVSWPAVDAALSEGAVTVFFSARLARADTNQTATEALQVLRTDLGSARLVLDGVTQFNTDDAAPSWQAYSGRARAQYRGVHTTTDKVKRSHVTVRGFELADSSAQGVYWEAGDDVVLDDLVIHANGTAPAIIFEYANRSGLPSTGITVRNCHLYSVTGECIYIGGVENMGGTSHANVLIENNLVRECGTRARNGDDWDGINIKDGMTGVVLRHNVVTEALRGIQVTSSDLVIEKNLVFDTHASSIVLGGGWSHGISSATRVSDNVLLRGTEAGLYLDADTDPATGPLLEHNTVVGAIGKPGAGFHFAGNAGLAATVNDNVVTGSNAGVDGWGHVNLAFGACDFFGNHSNVERATKGSAAEHCSGVDPKFGDLTKPAGDDGVFFTADDPWLPKASEVLTGSADGGALGARL